jgi:DNA polymerase III subunit chi
MSKVDFYVIKQPSEADMLFFACRLVEKVSTQNYKIYVHTDSKLTAETLDDLLWSYRSDSFLPHALAGSEDANDATIVIGFNESFTGTAEVLINLTAGIPDFHSEFQRIAEIVRNDEECKQIGREHWSIYKNKGYELNKTAV